MINPSVRVVVVFGIASVLIPSLLFAQAQRDVAPPTSWAAPLYWQPSRAEDQASRNEAGTFGERAERAIVSSAADVTPQAYPNADDVLTKAGSQPTDEAKASVQSYFLGHPGDDAIIDVRIALLDCLPDIPGNLPDRRPSPAEGAAGMGRIVQYGPFTDHGPFGQGGEMGG